MKICYRDQKWELKGEWSVREVIEEVGLSPDRLVAVRDGRVVSEDIVLKEDDEIRLLTLISGG